MPVFLSVALLLLTTFSPSNGRDCDVYSISWSFNFSTPFHSWFSQLDQMAITPIALGFPHFGSNITFKLVCNISPRKNECDKDACSQFKTETIQDDSESDYDSFRFKYAILLEYAKPNCSPNACLNLNDPSNDNLKFVPLVRLCSPSECQRQTGCSGSCNKTCIFDLNTQQISMWTRDDFRKFWKRHDLDVPLENGTRMTSEIEMIGDGLNPRGVTSLDRSLEFSGEMFEGTGSTIIISKESWTERLEFDPDDRGIMYGLRCLLHDPERPEAKPLEPKMRYLDGLLTITIDTRAWQSWRYLLLCTVAPHYRGKYHWYKFFISGRIVKNSTRKCQWPPWIKQQTSLIEDGECWLPEKDRKAWVCDPFNTRRFEFIVPEKAVTSTSTETTWPTTELNTTPSAWPATEARNRTPS